MRTNSGFLKQLGPIYERNKQEPWVILAMLVVSLLITVPVYAHRIYAGVSDFPEYNSYAQLILGGHYQQLSAAVLAHPVYPLLLVVIYLLAFQKASLDAITVLILAVAQTSTVLIVYWWFGKGRQNGNWLRAIWAVSLTLVAPLMIFFLLDRHFYLGYIGLATYHNPTIRLLQPVALLSFVCAVRVFTPLPNSWKVVLSSALLVIFSALIKPNYLVCILPALGLMVVVRLVWKKPVDWRLLMVGFLAPGVLILSVQLLLTYYLPGNDPSSILFSPLGVMERYSAYLLPKFFLSILFPLAVLLFNFRRVLRDDTLMLAWTGFLASLPQMYLLAESGDRFMHGNFLWGAQIMAFILFVASARFLWRALITAEKFPGRAKLVALAIYAAHFLAGIAYYVSLMFLARIS